MEAGPSATAKKATSVRTTRATTMTRIATVIRRANRHGGGSCRDVLAGCW